MKNGELLICVVLKKRIEHGLKVTSSAQPPSLARSGENVVVPMSFRIVASCVLLAICALHGIASPITAASYSSDGDELVKIPGGMVPKSKVHFIPEGGKVIHSSTEVRLLDADGTVLHASPLTKSSKPLLNLPNTSGPVIGPRNLESATILAVAQSPNGVLGFESNWQTPPLPQVNSGQLLMYFAALAPASIDALIQPTLQYGVSAAGGGEFWSLASWLITSEQVFVTNLTRLPIGVTPLDSFVVNEDEFLGTPTTHAWFCGFSSFQAAGLNVQTTETFDVAIVALEITGATTLGNLPNEPTDVEEIFILDDNSNSIFPIPWQLSQDTADGITITSTTPGNAEQILAFLYN